MSTPVEPSIAAAMENLWKKFLPQMEERVTALEAANQALAAGLLSPDQRTAASSAAHKLAGVLGTFGLAEGTTLAREAEDLYSAPSDMGAERVAQLSAIAEQLRGVIASRK
jgi:HPt (histidine-containing phosphotransfer) domain-containing protein